ncbi:MAG: serine hydrolase domain-containing protein [Pyrinomonadaceae bacterium]
MKTLLTFLILLILSVSAFSQDFDKAKLDQFFDALSANNKGMGSIAISKDGKIIYSRAVGTSHIGDKGYVSADVKTKYRIGSITKMFTATLVFGLVEEGKLKLDDTLDKFFPEIPKAKKITVAQMLDHHSGIHNITDDAEHYYSYYRRPQTHEQMLAIIAKTKPDFEPGAKAAYSNSNYILLGYIVEKVTGKSYKDALDERIVSKINLADTFYGGKINGANNESNSFDFLNGSWKILAETDMSIPGGAGGIVSTPTDLTKFITALFDGKLVSQKSLDRMKTITDGYGSGILQFPFDDKKLFGHTGGIDGFGSMLAYQPEEKLSVAYISNGTVYPVNNIMLAALAVYYNKPFEIPSFKLLEFSAEELAKFTGVYATPAIPIKISITAEGSTLFGQATGQGKFPLEAITKNKFKFEQAGIEIEFDTEKSTMTLKQGGQTFVFTKDK